MFGTDLKSKRLFIDRIFFYGAFSYLIIASLLSLTVPFFGDSKKYLEHEQAGCVIGQQCFCELVRDTTLRQPSAAWTSLAFVPFAFLILLIVKKDIGNEPLPFQLGVRFSALFAIECANIGFGSYWYHGTLTQFGEILDGIPMHCIGILLLSCLLIQWMSSNKEGVWNGNDGAIIYVFLCLPIFITYAFLSNWGRLTWYLMGGEIVLFVFMQILWVAVKKIHCNLQWFYGSLICLLLAFAIWNLDFSHTWCNNTAFIQGHGLWHILLALCVFCIFKFFHSVGTENNKDECAEKKISSNI
eukprot:TRINITY_DN1551_c0_g1_i1.p1 TRINITY_DN1551_c0_g1~~TRINITY_DN1551_c0_g1_i1.p1  ORF type:complete len:299 (-),score=49.63 TRINITY_DN1551_c0_g1_i1:398-1294(-)